MYSRRKLAYILQSELAVPCIKLKIKKGSVELIQPIRIYNTVVSRCSEFMSKLFSEIAK